MAQDATLHIKMDRGMARGLKKLASLRNKTMGQMVREAVVMCYQPDTIGLSQEQRRAVEAYRGAYLSLGRLAEVMGFDVLTMRKWLNEHGICQNSSYGEKDAANA